MSKNSIDYSGLANKIYKTAIKLQDRSSLETVAFDIVRFKDGDNGANLWQVQSADDGDYIVALYQPEEQEKSAELWDVVVNKTAGDLQISYKGDPLVRVAASRLNIPKNELHKMEGYLPAKLATNKKLVKALLNELTESSKIAVLHKYPELV